MEVSGQPQTPRTLRQYSLHRRQSWSRFLSSAASFTLTALTQSKTLVARFLSINTFHFTFTTFIKAAIFCVGQRRIHDPAAPDNFSSTPYTVRIRGFFPMSKAVQVK